MPELPMRATLTNLLIIILAANGIACACPSGTDAAASTEHHSTHGSENEQSGATGDCHGSDCAGDCDALDVAKSQRQEQAAGQVRLFADADDDDGDVMVLAGFAETFRKRTCSVVSLALEHTDRFVVTPVTLKVRMLA